MKNIYIMLALFFSILGFSQTEIYFKYDEAGNQRYRGPDQNGKQVEQVQNVEEFLNRSNEDQFWLGIQIYPVPVKDVLNIVWNEDNDTLINNITLYQHSTMAFLYQQDNLRSLKGQIQIDMTSYYPGVYVLNFHLKDGRVMSRNIIKE
ncbi:T9SS type A sorting domain-containing protein [Epilithonimonas vandammei]|uniref:Secretion system C-terminal sorting domain-containing protein n=1 Tax=Epilithonimonas vandammei TaxID=2487072 RepID=A0A3G8YD85_9FLAO|nr:T9SS type A sorting domain-containing protein [Epilithonimonas vandammei]AZI39191.1 hypothetical protein EIB74_04105 [Epilithonimonas vandammei]